MTNDKTVYNAHYLADGLAKWLKRPFLTNGYILFDIGFYTVFIIAAIVTQIWWLLIPVLVVTILGGLILVTIVSEVLSTKDAEIRRLRERLPGS